MNFNEALTMVGLPSTKRQMKKWERGEGLAYRAAQHFGPIHASRRDLNAAINLRNKEREDKNREIAEFNKNASPDKKVEMLPLEDLLPVPATKDEVRMWLNENSLPPAHLPPHFKIARGVR